MIMDVLGPVSQQAGGQKMEKIIDMTMAFPSGHPLDLLAIVTVCREPFVTHVHYREFDCKDIPNSSEELFTWMVKLYTEKEEMLDKYYKTGEFPHDLFDKDAQPPEIIQQDPFRYLLVHLFFITSVIMFYIILTTVYELFM